MKVQIEFRDRYQALGIPLPDPKTVCSGDCEGTGVVPIFEDETDPVYRQLWEKAEKEKPSNDGWHFVTCPTCNGSGHNRIVI